MRIIHVNSARVWGGAENWSADFCLGMAARGHDVTLICHPDGYLHDQMADQSPVRIAPVRIRGELDPIRVGQLRRLFRRLRPDVIVLYRRKDVKLGVTAAWLAGGFPIVHAERFGIPLTNSPIYRFFWTRGVDVVTAVSNAQRNELLRHSPWLDNTPVEVIAYGIDTQRYKPLPDERVRTRDIFGIRNDAFVMAYHGRLEPAKRVDLLIEALGIIGTDLPLAALIAGRGTEEDRLRERAAALGIEAHFAGFFDGIPALLSAADVAFHMSEVESLSRATIEAMACGLPVIASDSAGHPEQIEHGVQGLLVPTGDARGVADAIMAMATEPEKRALMARAARERAVSEFSYELMLERYEKLLDRVTGHSDKNGQQG